MEKRQARFRLAQLPNRARLAGRAKSSPVSSLATQGRQSDAGGVEAAIDGEDLPRDVACTIAAQKEHGLRQFFLEAVTVERNGVVIVGADLWRVNRFRHRGLDRPGSDAVDAD